MFSWADGGKRGGGLKELVQDPHKTRHKTTHKTLEVLRSNLAREPSPRWHKEGPLVVLQVMALLALPVLLPVEGPTLPPQIRKNKVLRTRPRTRPVVQDLHKYPYKTRTRLSHKTPSESCAHKAGLVRTRNLFQYNIVIRKYQQSSL